MAYVYVVDDDQDVLDSLSDALRQAGINCATFLDPYQFLATEISEETCSVILSFEFSLSALSGLDVLREIRRRGSRPPVTMLANMGMISQAIEAMRLGAIDVLQKPVGVLALFEAMDRSFVEDDRLLNAFQQANEAKQKLALLTPREIQVLTFLTEGFQSKQIAIRLDISVKTVDVHRNHLFRKLDVRSVAELVRLVARSQTS